MRNRSRNVMISAAVVALLYGGAGITAVQARDLVFDDSTLGGDGSGVWDTTSPNWLDAGASTTWVNTPPDSATFGSASNVFVGAATPREIELSQPITAQNINLYYSTNGAVYNIYDFFGGSLTLAGNITKQTGNGNPQLQLANGLTLTAGDHTFGGDDTPNDNAPELAINGNISGSGNVIVDNGSFVTWGTTAFNGANSYTGTTTISKGRLVVTTNTGLGSTSAGTIISNLGTLSFGGSATTLASPINLTEPITITRDTYTGGDYGLYGSAITFANTGTAQTHTITGPVVIDSADGRITVNTNTLVLPGGNITFGPNGANGVVSFGGDTAGFVVLQGANPAFATNGIKIVGNVEVQPESEAALGGATAPITFNGGLLKLLPTQTNFGTHPINTTSFSGGLNIPSGQSFTLDQALSGGSGLGMRGTGTLNIDASITGNGSAVFWDGGVVNVNSQVTVGGLRLRSPVVNIGTGAGVTTTSTFNSFGVDGPDNATINITGTGALVQTNGSDFNVSDNANTKGTINMSGNAVLTTGGIMFIGKSNGATGTINMSGGTLTVKRNDNFGFVLGDGRTGRSPTGIFNMSGGTFNTDGEVYVGEGGNNTTNVRAHGSWTQTAGTVNLNNWFVVGRESGVGTFDISGGTMNQTRGNMSLGDSGASGEANTINIHGTAAITTTGEFWIGNNGGDVANATMADTASVSVSNWLAIGRAGGTGTLNMSGGTITQTGGNWFTIGSGGTGTVNLSGGTINAARAYIGQNGGGTGTLNMTGGSVTFVNNAVFANADTVTGKLNLSGGTLTAPGFTAGNGGGTGTGTFTFNGGTLVAGADNTNFIGAKVTSVVSTGGAKINTNGHNVTVNSVLTHDAGLPGADGGLAKSGAGVLTLAGAETYTGPTTITGGTLTLAGSLANSNITIGSGATFDGTGTLNFALDGDTSTAIVNTGTFNITGLTLALGVTGTQSGSEYVIANDAGGTLVGTSFASVTGLPSGWSLDYDGTTAHPNSIVLAFGVPSLTGDTNHDGVVDLTDLNNVLNNFGSNTPGNPGDSNNDNIVDLTDLNNVLNNFGSHAAASALSTVPEPTTIGLLGLVGAASLARRRSRR